MWRKYLLLVLIIVCLGAGIFFWITTSKKDFLNPISTIFKPDFRPKLSAHLVDSPTLTGQIDQKVVGVNALTYLLYDLDRHVAYAGSNLNSPIAPGSFTKLMTSMVALDLLSPNELLSTTADSINKEPTVLGLKLGEQLTVAELIHASISTSANDAAATLAESGAKHLGLGLPDYVALMNQKAQLLNLTNTHFSNPEGYDDPGQKTTLTDLVKLIDAALTYDPIASAASADRQDLPVTSTHGFYYLPNWNGLLGVYPGVFGLKIAHTDEAGYSTIVLSKRNNIRLVAVVAGAKTLLERDLFASRLLDYGFSKSKLTKINLTEKELKAKYKIWNDLAAKIRAELGITK